MEPEQQRNSRPSLQDILDSFFGLSERVANADTDNSLDPFVMISMRRAIEELRRYIPGLEAPPEPLAALSHGRCALLALEHGEYRLALENTLRALSFSPHDATLWHYAALSCFGFLAVEDGHRMLRHAHWINPGHAQVNQDLRELNDWIESRWTRDGGEGASPLECLPPRLRPKPRLPFA